MVHGSDVFFAGIIITILFFIVYLGVEGHFSESHSGRNPGCFVWIFTYFAVIAFYFGIRPLFFPGGFGNFELVAIITAVILLVIALILAYTESH